MVRELDVFVIVFVSCYRFRSWWPDLEGDIWRKDYTPEARFRSDNGRDGLYKELSPSTYYITPDSNLTFLRKFWVPTAGDDAVRANGARPEIRYAEVHNTGK